MLVIFKSRLKIKKSNFLMKKVELSSFFMKGHLLHNIHNNDNKNQSKIKTKAEKLYYHQPRRKKEFQFSLLPMYFFLLSNADLTLSSPI